MRNITEGRKFLAIGIDLGATKTAIAIVDSEGNVLASDRLQTRPEDGPEYAVKRIAKQVRSTLKDIEGDISGIGLGVAGLTDPEFGKLIYGKNLNWRDVELAAMLHSYLDDPLPVFIQTDTNAQALGESYFGSAQGYRDFIYVTLGSGLGGAVVANGSLVTGRSNMGGGIGLLSLDPNGLPDNSGIRGCTETVISARGLVTLFKEIQAQGMYQSKLGDFDEITTELIIQAAGEEDSLALASLEEMGSYLGQVFSFFVAILNPAMIVISGGLGLATFPWVIPAAREELERRTYKDAYIDLEIVPSTLSSSAVGAACLVFESKGLRSSPF